MSHRNIQKAFLGPCIWNSYEYWACKVFNNVDWCIVGVNLKGANLEGSNMAGVNLRVATLKNANLQNCDLRAAVLAGADLEVYVHFLFLTAVLHCHICVYFLHF